MTAGVRAVGLAAVAAVVVAVGVAVVPGGGADRHHVTIVVPAAAHFFAGLDVRAAGQKVGEVTATTVTRDRRARLTLRIDNEAVWPLPRGTSAQIRWGGTIKFIARYVELRPARDRGQGALPEGGRVAAAPVPQEFDQVFATFDKRTRADLRRMLASAGGAIGDAEDELGNALDRAPPAIRELSAVVQDVGGDREALRTLVRSSDRVVAAIHGSEPGVGRLVAGAGTTFAAVAAQARALSSALAAAPVMFRAANGTLARTDRTLAAADALLSDLSPGVTGVRRLAGPLRAVLGRVVDVAPDATASLRSLRRAAPDLNPFLGKARSLMPAIGSSARQLARQVHCVRPYSPEIAGLASTWAGWFGAADGKDHYMRAEAGTFPWSNADPRTPGELHDLLPQITSAFPRPPGQLVGQPWLIPECGITADALDPSKDPEARRFNLSKRPLTTDDSDHREPAR